ncbi:M56 family metallopeptidase [Kineosporia succinea]|uniref:Zn-dependent protease with chaperone function n=1 Tax=Kineosporia succinea TaxID=84632 RepID=A0ABT9P8S9_9ACTN|nr:M56 family metallopeptidase [Kineosporia succinea]MDP9828824.1 Zn-dependent protease with chaperone function [Kineosporia succinea]
MSLLLPALVGVLLTLVPRPLSRARWAQRRPREAAVVWVVYALVTAYLLLLALALAVGSLWPAGLFLLWMLVRLTQTVRGLRRSQRRHQEALALVADYDPLLRVHVLNDDRPLAYCLPNGARPMVVVTRGALELADSAEMRAILAHERCHARNRHDLLVTGFLAWQRIFPFVPSCRAAAEAVGAVTEAWADDQAAAEVSHAVTLRAIMRLGSGVPGGLDHLGWEPDPATLSRVRRLMGQMAEGRLSPGPALTGR